MGDERDAFLILRDHPSHSGHPIMLDNLIENGLEQALIPNAPGPYPNW
jgi:hypothetical protein